MPRNYDEMAAAEDRSFIIRGEKFTIVRGSPQLVGRLDARQDEYTNLEDKARTSDAGLAMLKDRLVMMVDDQNGSAARLTKLYEGEEFTYGELVDLQNWGYEVLTALPTMPPAPSAPGRGKTAASSKAE